jgi:hypothetical protein
VAHIQSAKVSYPICGRKHLNPAAEAQFSRRRRCIGEACILRFAFATARSSRGTGGGGFRGKPMATSLYDLSVPTFLQTLRAVGAFLDRAARHCAETGVDPNDFVHARLFGDMAPFHFQIEAAWHHSVWGLEAVKTGLFSPPALVGPVPFAELQAMIGKAETTLEAFTPDEVNGWAGKDLDLQIGPRRLAFTSETLILSFSLPNFHFHAVTAYDILRTLGVPLGKRDYEGRLRTRALNVGA